MRHDARQLVYAVLLAAPLRALRAPAVPAFRRCPLKKAAVDAAAASAIAAEADPEDASDAARAWFDAVRLAAPACAPDDALAGARARGAAALEGVALPAARAEAWRFTRLRDFWGCATGGAVAGAAAVTAADLEGWLPDGDGPVAVVVDGRYEPALSVAARTENVYVGSVADAPPDVLADLDLAALPEVDLEATLPPRNALGSAAWVALNAACAADATIVWCRGATASVAVVHVRSAAAGVAHARTLVHVADGGALRLRESFFTVGAARDLPAKTACVNARTTAAVRPGGDLALVLDAHAPDQVHVHHVAADVAADASFACRSLSDAAAVARVAVEANLVAPGAHFDFAGLQLGGAHQNLDARTALRHAASDGSSTQDVRNVAAGGARITFKGRIAVPQAGQRTNADQICKSLLLDDESTVDAMPSLEIVADDVKCTHGATVADLDEEGVFYLASRGLDDADARALLVKAFCYEIVAKCGDDLVPPNTRKRIDDKLERTGKRSGAVAERKWSSI